MARVRKWALVGVVGCIGLSILRPALFAEEPPKKDASKQNYDDVFQDGLRAEADEKWADAIQFYLLAMAKNSKSPWPKERLKGLFRTLQKKEIVVEPYESLLPQAMRDEFRSSGVIKTVYDSEKGAKDLNAYIWMTILAAIGLVGIALIVLAVKSKRSETEAQRLQVAMRKEKKPAAKPSNVSSATHETKSIKRPDLPKKDVKLNEEARAHITGVVANVKSLNLDEKKIEELTGARRVDVAALTESGVIDAFVEDWVTEVKTEQTDQGKFSKMTVDASLVFDDNGEQKSG